MLIHNYGLFWRREDVYWGKGNDAGHLLGTLAGGKNYGPFDFREQVGVYVLYDSNFRIVYVGHAGKGNQKLLARLRTHTRDHLSDRWDRFSWFGLRRVLQSGDLSKVPQGHVSTSVFKVINQMEAVLIASTEPRLNRSSGNFGSDGEQYTQYRDHEKLQPSTDALLTRIVDQIERLAE